VKIWGDNWIPNSNSHQLIVPIIPTLAESKVQMLIDGDTNWWNIYTFVGATFPPTDC
jgi:hypothetical protein